MATIHIDTTIEEQRKVYDFIKNLQGEQLSVSAIANGANLSQSRTRYAIDDLVLGGYIERVPVKQFNRMYVRYSYIVRKEFVDASNYTS